MHMRFLSRRWSSACWMIAALTAPTIAPAQTDNLAAIIAGLREDVRILDERTRSLQAEIEQLKRENRDLRENANRGNFVTPERLTTAVSELEAAIRAGDKEVALQLTKQMERLATQTQAALDAIAKNTGGRAPSTAGPAFTPDPNYPKTGITYTVQAGDTLASIAQRHNSSVIWIQSANMIAEPRALQVGQTLFIPQK